MGCKSSRDLQHPENTKEDFVSITTDTKEKTNNMFLVAENGLIGEGGFGRVMAALLVAKRDWYAVKEINKVSFQLYILIYDIADYI